MSSSFLQQLFRRPWVWVALVIVFIDRVLKELAGHFTFGLPFIEFRLVPNDQFAFSLPVSNQWAIGITSVVLGAVFVFFLQAIRRRSWRTVEALVLVTLGAASNLLDRFVHGYVVDYLAWGGTASAANVADGMIFIGAILLVVGNRQGNSSSTIIEIYQRYQIMPILQLHQLRVAAVAQKICESLKQPVDTTAVVQACLLHDMGNILKFDFTVLPESLQPEGLTYWQSMKESFQKKYGLEEHQATLAIADELGVSKSARALIDAIGFTKVAETRRTASLEAKICNYADMRVAPYGVVSIAERMADGHKRYAGRSDRHHLDEQTRHYYANELQQAENELFTQSRLKPSDIAEAGIQPTVQQLRHYQLAVLADKNDQVPNSNNQTRTKDQ